MDVAVQVLRAELVERASVGAFQDGPEALYTVGVGLTPDIFSDRVLDRFMVGKSMVGQGVIGVDNGTGLDVLHDEPAHGLALGVGHNASLDAVGAPVFDPGNGGLAHGPTASASQRLALGVAHVAPFTTKERLVHFHGAGEVAVPILGTFPGFPNPVEHEPGGALRDSDISVQLHGGNTFQTCQFQVDGDSPLAQRGLAVSEHGVSSNREIFPAIGTPVRHGLSIRRLFGLGRSAMTAATLVWPECFLKPRGSGFLVGKHLYQLDDCQSVSEVLAGAFRVPHDDYIVQESTGAVKRSE